MRHSALILIALVASLGAAHAADPIKIPFAVVEKHYKAAECTNDLSKDDDYTGEDLGGGLQLVEIYCWRAAYQAGSIFLAVDPKAPEKARLLEFPFWSRKGISKQKSLTDPSYNSVKRTLGSAHKGRGAGDCGDVGQWKWGGKEFKLVKFWSKPNCDGKPFDEGRRWQVYPPKR